MYLWKWTGKVDQERRLYDVIHKVGNRKYYQEEEEEKNEFSGGTLSPWRGVAKRGGGRNEANTHRTIEGESIMRVCLSKFSIARQNGPLKMEINIRRRLISIANHKPPLYSLYRLPHPPSSLPFKD